MWERIQGPQVWQHPNWSPLKASGLKVVPLGDNQSTSVSRVPIPDSPGWGVPAPPRGFWVPQGLEPG